MDSADREALQKFYAIVDKAVKEGGGDDEIPQRAEQPSGERWTRKRWLHPSSIYKAFVVGLIEAEPWDAVPPPEFHAMCAMVRAAACKAYPDVAKVSMLDAYQGLWKWTSGDLGKWAEDAGIDLALVIDNAMLALASEVAAAEAKLASVED